MLVQQSLVPDNPPNSLINTLHLDSQDFISRVLLLSVIGPQTIGVAISSRMDKNECTAEITCTQSLPAFSNFRICSRLFNCPFRSSGFFKRLQNFVLGGNGGVDIEIAIASFLGVIQNGDNSLT